MTDDSQDQSSQYSTLFIFKESNAIRKQCKAIANSGTFEIFILIVIVVNCIGLGFGLYLPDTDKTAQLLEKAEIYFLVIFIAEMVLKVVAFGFAFHPGSYLRNPWNWIDFFVIVLGIVSLFPLGIDLDVLRMLRVFRLLRLLRFIKIIRNKD